MSRDAARTSAHAAEEAWAKPSFMVNRVNLNLQVLPSQKMLSSPALPKTELVPKASIALKLAGAPNFRDLGGYAVQGGRMIRRGLVFRSGHLGELTEADYATLAPLGIRYVFDLRTVEERDSAPTHWPGAAPRFIPLPAPFGPNDIAALMKRLSDPAFDGAQAREFLREGMAGLPFCAAPGISAWLRALAAGEIPCIIHCSAGKDRTGLFTAVLLTLLGVGRETAMHDFLRTNEVAADNMAASVRAMPASVQTRISPAVVEALGRVRAEYLEAAFERIDANYGSFDNYRRAALEIDDSDVERLRSRLLTA
jgi:protein-tyrosine phosphatase